MEHKTSKEVVSITYTQEKIFFAAATFRFGQIEKLAMYFGL